MEIHYISTQHIDGEVGEVSIVYLYLLHRQWCMIEPRNELISLSFPAHFQLISDITTLSQQT